MTGVCTRQHTYRAYTHSTLNICANKILKRLYHFQSAMGNFYMLKAVVLCIVFLVAILIIWNTFVSNNNVQPSFRITLNQYNNEDLDCATRGFTVNKSDIKHDKNLALYSCNKNQLITENIKYHLNTPLTRRHNLPINCKKFFEGDKLELQKAVRVRLQNDDLGSRRVPSSLHECKTYVAQFGYITDSLSEDEQNFPIAYSIVM